MSKGYKLFRNEIGYASTQMDIAFLVKTILDLNAWFCLAWGALNYHGKRLSNKEKIECLCVCVCVYICMSSFWGFLFHQIFFLCIFVFFDRLLIYLNFALFPKQIFLILGRRFVGFVLIITFLILKYKHICLYLL